MRKRSLPEATTRSETAAGPRHLSTRVPENAAREQRAKKEEENAALARLTERYIRATVLRSYNLNDAGSGLPPFLRNDPLTERLPFLPDLAELEWHIARAFHAHEHPPLDPTPLSTWTMAEWERAVLRFQPSVALVSSAWPIRSIWECRETPVEQIDLEMTDRPERVLIYRNGLQVCCESVDAHEATVLAALLAGRSLGDTARSIEGAGDGGSLPAAAFARWMRAGIIVRCCLARPARAGGRRVRPRRRHVPSRAGR